MQLLQKITAAKKFWEWFTENQDQYRQLIKLEEDEMMALFDEINERVQQYCSKLEVNISLGDMAVHTLIISANGNVDYFEAVDDLVRMAPRLRQWTFIALRPPADEWPIEFTYEGLKISVDRLWFAPMLHDDEPHKLGIMVYFKGYKKNKEDIYFGAANEMLERLLGERASALDVPYLGVDVYPGEQTDLTIWEMANLESYIAFWKETVMMN